MNKINLKGFNIEKLFVDFDLHGKKGLFYTVLIGIIFGTICGIPTLLDTSFMNLAQGYEFWIVQ